jgi:multidrug resistance efflux pump
MRIRVLAVFGTLFCAGAVMAAPVAAPKPATPSSSAEPSAAEKQQQLESERKLTEAFWGQNNFQLNGTLLGADAEHGSIAVKRGSLPVALLIVPETVTVQVNGKKGSLADIKPGAEVRATFNLAQQYPIALTVNVTQSASTTAPLSPLAPPPNPAAPPPSPSPSAPPPAP